MGNCQGPAPDSNSKSIEKDLMQSKKDFRNQVRILLLGNLESGKSTFIKQFAFLNNVFDNKQRKEYVDILRKTTVDCMQKVLAANRALDIGIEESNRDAATKLMELDWTDTEKAYPMMAQLLNDAGVKATLEKRESNLFYVPECCEYLFQQMERVWTADFKPTNQDILRVRQTTLGIVETPITYNKTSFRFIDVGGQRTERRKWIKCFDNVTALLYCIALDEYNLTLPEDTTANRMVESLKVFTDILNVRDLLNLPIIILYNKSDLLKKKIDKYDLSEVFKEYKGGPDYDAALKFIMNVYDLLIKTSNETHKIERHVFPHITNALDEENIKFVWKAVVDITLQNLVQEYSAI